MRERRRFDNKRAKPNSKVITYRDSLLYPIKNGSSTQKVRFSIYGLFLLLPNPTDSPQPDNLSIRIVNLTGKN